MKAVGYLQFGARRPAHEHLYGAHRLGAARWMALEIDPLIDNHGGAKPR